MPWRLRTRRPLHPATSRARPRGSLTASFAAQQVRLRLNRAAGEYRQRGSMAMTTRRAQPKATWRPGHIPRPPRGRALACHPVVSARRRHPSRRAGPGSGRATRQRQRRGNRLQYTAPVITSPTATAGRRNRSQPGAVSSAAAAMAAADAAKIAGQLPCTRLPAPAQKIAAAGMVSGQQQRGAIAQPPPARCRRRDPATAMTKTRGVAS